MGHHDSCDQWPMTYTQVIRVRVICNDRITIWPITHLTHDPWPSTRVTRVRSRVTSDDPDPCEQLTMTHLTRDPWPSTRVRSRVTSDDPDPCEQLTMTHLARDPWPGTRVIRVRSWVGAYDRDPCDPSNTDPWPTWPVIHYPVRWKGQASTSTISVYIELQTVWLTFVSKRVHLSNFFNLG